MADITFRSSPSDLLTALRRVQVARERLLGRLWRDTEALVASRQVLSEFFRDAWRAPAHFRQRAERALRDLEAERARLVTTVQQQAGSLLEALVRSLHLASRGEVGELQQRIGVLEQRLERLGTLQNVAAREWAPRSAEAS